MGYTHYWNQTKNFTPDEWAQVSEDVRAIVTDVQMIENIPLANGLGEVGTQPEFTHARIYLNGVGEDEYETFGVHCKRQRDGQGDNFCKTEHRRYDIAVTAILCYLSSIAKSHHVTSDGHASDFIAGLELARRALPRYANELDFPMGVLQEDRWIGPWIYHLTELYRFAYCVDGHAYIIRVKDGRSYRFDSHAEAGAWVAKNKAVLDASGSFDDKRVRSLKTRQNNLFRTMIDSLDSFYPQRAVQPPAFVRPNQFAAFEQTRRADLSSLLAAAS